MPRQNRELGSIALGVLREPVELTEETDTLTMADRQGRAIRATTEALDEISGLQVNHKKDLIVQREIEGFWRIRFEGGGLLPEELRGIYTKHAYAMTACEKYLAERDKPKREYRKSKKVEDNGKDKTSTS